MTRRRGSRCIGVVLAFLLAAVLAPGRGLAETDDPDWTVTLKTKFLFNSHTSYEFGNPFSPFQSPLSRLEFPLESVWAGGEIRRRLGRLSVGVEYLSSVSDQDAGTFRDSDWDDEETPTRLSIYSESQCRLRPSWQVAADIDVQVADLVTLPAGFGVRPMLGFRFQRFSFMAHDGTQYTYDAYGRVDGVDPMPGDSISFKQDWYQLVAGLRLGYEWDRPPVLHRIAITSQVDWSYVFGRNLDRHLLRGDRTTREKTAGNAWHATLGVMFGLTESLDLGVEGEYLCIDTRGSHTWRDEGQSMTWSHGVRVWSEQSSVSVKVAYRF